MSDEYIINKILSENKITDILLNRGIKPVKRSNKRYSYHCPLPEHPGDNDPSFIVYNPETDDETQTYHCFGCGSGSTVIDLVAELDGITTLDSFKTFYNKTKIDEKERADSIIISIQDASEMTQRLCNMGYKNRKGVELLFIKISSLCRMHLDRTERDEEEVEFFHRVYKIIEDYGRSCDEDMLLKIYDALYDGILNRFEKYQKRKEKIWADNPWK